MDFLTQHPLYVVLVTALMIWAGIAWYISRVDRRVAELEQRIKR